MNKKIFNTYLFYVIVAIYWYSTNTYIPIITPYLEQINISPSTIGLIIGAYGLMQVLLQFPIGLLSDKINKRKIFVILGLFLSAVSSFGMFCTKDPVLLIILRGLTGVAGSSWVIMTILFSSYFTKEESAGKISYLTAANNIGQLVAMLTAGVIATYFSYKGTFLAGSIVGIVGTILSLFIKENKVEKKQIPVLKSVRSLLADKTLITCSILCLVVQFIAYGAVNTFTAKVATNIGANEFELSFISTVMTIPRILSSMICGFLLIKKVKSQGIIIISFLIIALACIITPFASNMFMLYLGAFLSGTGTGTAYAILIGICTKNVRDELKSTAMGISQTIFCLGTFLGPVFIGSIIETQSVNAGFLFATVISILTAMYVFMIKDKSLFETSKN